MKQIKKMLAALLMAAICLSMVAALAESGTIWTTGSVNMRKGAGLDYGSIRTISSGKKLDYDKTSKDDRGVTWYRISYKGRTGWVSSKYASKSKPSGSSGSSSSSEGKVTTTASVNLRKGAGLDYSVIRTVPEGATLSYDKTSKDGRGVVWYRVTYKKRTGWVSSKYTNKGGSSSSSSGKTTGKKLKTTGNVNLRTGAGLDYNDIRSIPNGTTLTYDETRKDDRGVVWYHVSYDGKTGWVSSKYAKKK